MDFDIIDRLKKNNKIYYVIKCRICGHIKEIDKYNYETSLKKKKGLLHNGMNCKDNYYNSFIGQEIGDYVVDSRDSFSYNLHCKRCGTKEKLLLRSLQIADCHSHAHVIRCLKNLPDSEIKSVIAERFQNIKQRCGNPMNNNYSHYGARQITCDYEFAIDLYYDFHEEIESHAKIYGLRNSTFDRIDVNKGYTKDNLRITTQSVQSTNTTRKKLFILEKGNERVLCDNAMEFGRQYNVNGRGVGNVVRGTSKTAGGWHLYKLCNLEDNIDKIMKEESVTTKLITT